MVEPEVGDFVISTETIYEIIEINKEGLNKYYTVRLLDSPANVLAFMQSDGREHYDYFGISLSKLRHLGNIVKKEEASKAIEVLFKK